jgi:glycosyltransferase involved in cell wall biosynthesis
LLNVDGEARQVMQQARGGVFVPPEDPRLLADALLQLRQQPEACRQMGSSGRDFTIQHYSRQAQAEKLAQLLEAVLT